ncbi:MAG: hypothetical protein NTY76_02565 [Candidatus Omnitrophica bacterium]|nr:hypothetical protein [Candidatus Omnitrophota bacterium]
MRNYALIPAKERSSRCHNKNWRDFTGGYSLVDFAVKTTPEGIFDTVIVSTDKKGYSVPKGVSAHLRGKELAGEDSSVMDLIKVIIKEYGMRDSDYLWLLNPTSPFRSLKDYREISQLIREERPKAVISVTGVSPFIWKGDRPLFPTSGKRPNTQDFKKQYAVENGMFYIMNVGYFRRRSSWYGNGTMLYEQKRLESLVDINTEEDFKEAKKIAKRRAA